VGPSLEALQTLIAELPDDRRKKWQGKNAD
jgi:hypothetical protein